MRDMYQHVVTLRGFADGRPKLGHVDALGKLPSAPASSSVAGDPLDAVIIGLMLLGGVTVTGRGAKPHKRLVLWTDGVSPVQGADEQLQPVVDQAVSMGVRVDVVEIDTPAHAGGGGATGKARTAASAAAAASSSSSSAAAVPGLTKQQAADRAATLATLHALVAGTSGTYRTADTLLAALATLRKAASVHPVSKFRGDLTIGGSDTVRIPVWAYAFTAETKLKAMKRATRALLDEEGRPKAAAAAAGAGGGGGDGGDDDDEEGGGGGAGAGGSGGGKPWAVNFKRTYHAVPLATSSSAHGEGGGGGGGGDRPADAEGADVGGQSEQQQQEQAGEPLEEESMGKMYRYGSDAFTLGAGEAGALKWEHERELVVVAFTPAHAIPRYMVHEGVDVLVPTQDPKHAGREAAAGALSALARAMAAEGRVAIARFIRRKGASPAWGMLVPGLAFRGGGADGGPPPPHDGGGSSSSSSGGGDFDDDEEGGGDDARGPHGGSGGGGVVVSGFERRYVVSSPVESGNTKAQHDVLLFCPLPYEDDLRKYAFANFGAVRSGGGAAGARGGWGGGKRGGTAGATDTTHTSLD
jgi:hypothetical protein